MYILAQGKDVLGQALCFGTKADASRNWRQVALPGLLLLLAAVSSEAQQAARQVLLLQSLDRGNLPVDQFTGNFRVELDQRAATPVNVVQVMVGPIGTVAASEQAVVNYIRATFIDHSDPDLIVSIGGPAAVFARKHRQHLFPDTPLLLASVDQRWLANAPLGKSETAVAIAADYPRVVDAILQLLPQTRQVVMVIGSGQIGRFWHRELEGAFKRFRNRLTFVWLGDLSLEDTLSFCMNLPDNSAIFYLTFGTDATGAAYADERVFAELHARASAPLFAALSPYFGAGIVGGSLMSIDELARESADVAIRLLNGASPASIKLPPQLGGQPIFDWRELERWGIPEHRLPPDSIVRYRAPSLWSAYRRAVLIAMGVLAIQSLLIVGLLYQRHARRRAERDSRRSLALAADVSRRETMSAMTSSIGHELGQPLGTILYTVQALQMMVTENRATSDTMAEILSDIQTQGVHATQIIDRHRTMLKSRQLDTKPIDLRAVIDETLALVAHDMSVRQVEVTVDLLSRRCVIAGDQVLLQQVFVNLVVNAMDAMAETPLPRRYLTIGCDVRATEVDVSVRDTGHGLPAHILDTLFTPFVTTKARGLGIGLTIARSIVDAHGGVIVGRNNPEGGVTFTVTLRRSASTSVADALH